VGTNQCCKMIVASSSSPWKIGLRKCHGGILLTFRGVASTDTGNRGKATTSEHKEQVKRMRKVLGDCNVDNDDSANAWESLWSEDVTPWDLGGPTKALISELERKHSEEPETLMWKTALIPGCGSGYDLLSLARFWDSQAASGCDETGPINRTVVGLEVAPTSLERAKSYLAQARDSNDNKLLRYTDIQLFSGNFFSDPSTWALFHHEKAANIANDNLWGQESGRSFDFVFDSTFFCAIPPTLRLEWGRQITHLLTRNAASLDEQKRSFLSAEEWRQQKHPASLVKGGQLLTLMFPYVPTARPGSPGPPYPVSASDYREALNIPTDTFSQHNRMKEHLRLTTSLPYPNKDTAPTRRGQELVGWWSFGSCERNSATNLRS
jgi:hypothetical protein